MMKRDGRDLDGDQPPRKMQKGESGGSTVRFLIPARAAGLIIGRGGENIKRIRTQVIKFSVTILMLSFLLHCLSDASSFSFSNMIYYFRSFYAPTLSMT